MRAIRATSGVRHARVAQQRIPHGLAVHPLEHDPLGGLAVLRRLDLLHEREAAQPLVDVAPDLLDVLFVVLIGFDRRFGGGPRERGQLVLLLGRACDELEAGAALVDEHDRAAD